MINIKKLAEDIFKAPSQEDLVERGFLANNIYRLHSIISILGANPWSSNSKVESSVVTSLFPHGAFYFSRHFDNVFGYIRKALSKLEEIPSEIKSSPKYYKSKYKNRNVIIKFYGRKADSMFVEAKNEEVNKKSSCKGKVFV